ncbi:Site-specific DNA recombinase [Streptomyces sp. DI166]|uniref:recombinase family protein n=1 Tax=Streptomyces sp. DI166 TaxID=1839783 RepID=UPI0007F5569A|nr:recombinase family protein [Streptomyces sp. DI166]SBT89420.1 Site-specific DNA recombinase [Streptomyces sp. DI166]
MPIAPEYLHLVYPDLAPFEAFLYGRNSADPKKKARSVADQLDEGRALCAEHGWPVKRVFKDPGISASRYARKGRDDFEEMLAEIEAGECRILVAWEASRYYRDLEIYVRLRNACYAAGVLLCYNGMVYDLSKRADRKATAQDAIQAEDEAEGIRDRNVRTQKQNASKGRPHGPVLTGYKRVYDPETGELINQVPYEPQVETVGWWFELAEAGTPSNGIARDTKERKLKVAAELAAAGMEPGEVTKELIDRALLTRYGNDWRGKAITQVLKNKAYIGRKVHEGKDIGKASWDQLIPGEEFVERFYNVQAILEGRELGSAHDTSVKHLLSRIPWCGEHGEHEPVVRWKYDVNGHHTYSCSERGDVSVNAIRLEAFVEEAVLTWLGSDKAVAAFQRGNRPAEAKRAQLQLAGMEQQLREARALSTQFGPDGQPRMSALTLADLESSLRPQIEKLRERIEQASVPPLLRGLVGNRDADTVWSRLDMHAQRMVLRKVVTIRLYRAPAQGSKVLSGRVKLSFYGEPGFKPEGPRSRA